MRLQDAEALGTTLRDNGVVIDLVAQDFYADLCRLITAAETVQHDSEMHMLDKRLRHLCKRYFKDVTKWVEQERKRHPHNILSPEAHHIELHARELSKEFEKQLLRHALLFMHLNRGQIQMRRSLKDVVDNFQVVKSKTQLDVDGTTGLLIKRAYKEKRRLLEKRARMIRMQNVLTQLKEMLEAFRPALNTALTHHDADKGYTSLCKALRGGDFKRADATVKRWGCRKRPIGAGRRYRRSMMIVQEQGQKIIDLVRNNKDDLAIHRGYIIDLNESKMLFSFLMADEQRVDKFLSKYNVRYMVHRFKHLLVLGQRLLEMGTIGGLLVLHARLISGLAFPLQEEEKIRQYRDYVLNRVDALHTKEMPELPYFFNDMENTLEELRFMISETWAIQDQSKLLS